MQKHIIKLFICFSIAFTMAILSCCDFAAAQTPFDGKKILSDSLHKVPYFKSSVDHGVVQKYFVRAGLQLGLAEVLPWTYDRYIANKDYAKISWQTIGSNLKPSSWAWDNDEFQTNQFGHPYHGSQFFSAFRSNGYSFWQSVPTTFAGSYIWESLAENQAPAPNDFVNTGFGGVVLGEMTYRLSRRIVNNSRTGFRRQMSEVAGFLINPMNGLTRIMDGKWGRVNHNKIEQDTTKVTVEFDFGARRFKATATNSLKSGGFGWYGRVKLLYGSRYENYETPFSNIYINVEIGQDDSSKLNRVNVYGSLAGWEIAGDEKKEQLVILSANYDFIHNEAFFYGAQSFNANIFSEYKLTNKLSFNTSIGAGPVILGAVPDSYPFRGRNYDYTTGVAYSGNAGINFMEKLLVSIDYRGNWLVTINGSASHYFLHTVTLDAQYFVVKKFSLAMQPGYFVLHGKYNDHPSVDKRYPFFRLSGRYYFNL